jgi:hypothetical protein
MQKKLFLALKLAFGLLFVIVFVSVEHTAQAQGKISNALPTPIVFQAAGPTAQSITATIDAFRAALGDPNNANNKGPLPSGRRCRRNNEPSNAVQRLPRYSREPIYDTGNWSFASSASWRTAEWTCGTL